MTAPAPEGLRVHTLLSDVLTAIQNAALQLGVTLPGKQYVTTGEAVHDCPQVAVVGTRIDTGLPGGATGIAWPNGGCPVPALNLTISLEIARPTVSPGNQAVIEGSALTAAAKVQSADAEVLLDAVRTVTAAPNNLGDVTASIIFPPQSGGYAVTVCTLKVMLP